MLFSQYDQQLKQIQSTRERGESCLTCAVGLVAKAASSGDAALVDLAEAVSPIANTRGWPSTRSVGSVAQVPRADIGKGNPSLWRVVDAVRPAHHVSSVLAYCLYSVNSSELDQILDMTQVFVDPRMKYYIVDRCNTPSVANSCTQE